MAASQKWGPPSTAEKGIEELSCCLFLVIGRMQQQQQQEKQLQGHLIKEIEMFPTTTTNGSLL